MAGRRDGDAAVGGVFAGLGAWLASYLVVYVAVAPRVRETVFWRVVELTDAGSAWQVVGLVFYNAHFVAANVRAPFLGTAAVNLVGREGTAVALYAVPPALLFAAGAVAAVLAGRVEPDAGAAAGMVVSLGYLPPSLAGAFLMRVGAGVAVASPDTLTAVVLAGVLYPVAFGGLGGAAAAALR